MSPTTSKPTASAHHLYMSAAVIVMLVAAFMRLHRILEVPPGPFYDEAVNILISRGIAYGGQFPVYTMAFVGREPLYHYVLAILMRLTGHELLALPLTTVFFGIVTVAGVLAFAREFFRDYRHGIWLSLFAGALAATTFWPVTSSRLGVRAISVACMTSLTLVFLMRYWRRGRIRDAVLSGVFTGLTAYTYIPNRFVPFALALAIGWLWFRQPGKLTLRGLAIMVGTGLLVALPMLIFVAQHPDVIAHRASQVAAVRPDMPPLQIVIGVLQGVVGFFSGFGFQGDPVLYYNVPGRPVFNPVLATLFYMGLAVLIVLAFSRTQYAGPAGMAGAWLSIMLLPSSLSQEPFMTLRSLGTLSAALLLPSLGVAAVLWIIERYRSIGAGIMALIWALTLGLTARETYRDYFFVWATNPDLYAVREADLADLSQWLNTHNTQGSELYVLTYNYRPPTMAILAEDFDRIRWVAGGQTIVLPPNGQDAYIALPHSTMGVGDPEWLTSHLTFTEEIAAPLQPDGKPKFQVFHLDADTPQPQPSVQQTLDFGSSIRLIGYDPEPSEDGDIAVTLYWEILQPAPLTDYGVVAHLVDAWGFTWATSGIFDYPPEQWKPGEIIVQQVAFERPTGLPPGDYAIRLEWYSPETRQRMPLVRDGAFGGIYGTVEPIPVDSYVWEERPSIPDQYPLDVTSDAMHLVGYDRESIDIDAGDVLRFALYWEAVSEPQADRLVDVSLVSASGNSTILSSHHPVHGTYPASLWQAGEIITDRYAIRLAPDLAAGTYTLKVQIGGGSNPLSLGDVTVHQRDRLFAAPETEHEQAAEFADIVRLVGYDLPGMAVRGETVALRAVWQAIEPPDVSYSVFVHVIDSAGSIVAQHDGIPRGDYSLDRWLPGEVVIDEIPLALPNELTSGEYRIRLGFYLPETGQRLPVYSSSGEAGSDYIVLDAAIVIR